MQTSRGREYEGVSFEVTYQYGQIGDNNQQVVY